MSLEIRDWRCGYGAWVVNECVCLEACNVENIGGMCLELVDLSEREKALSKYLKIPLSLFELQNINSRLPIPL